MEKSTIILLIMMQAMMYLQAAHAWKIDLGGRREFEGKESDEIINDRLEAMIRSGYATEDDIFALIDDDANWVEGIGTETESNDYTPQTTDYLTVTEDFMQSIESEEETTDEPMSDWRETKAEVLATASVANDEMGNVIEIPITAKSAGFSERSTEILVLVKSAKTSVNEDDELTVNVILDRDMHGQRNGETFPTVTGTVEKDAKEIIVTLSSADDLIENATRLWITVTTNDPSEVVIDVPLAVLETVSGHDNLSGILVIGSESDISLDGVDTRPVTITVSNISVRNELEKKVFTRSLRNKKKKTASKKKLKNNDEIAPEEQTGTADESVASEESAVVAEDASFPESTASDENTAPAESGVTAESDASAESTVSDESTSPTTEADSAENEEYNLEIESPDEVSTTQSNNEGTKCTAKAPTTILPASAESDEHPPKCKPQEWDSVDSEEEDSYSDTAEYSSIAHSSEEATTQKDGILDAIAQAVLGVYQGIGETTFHRHSGRRKRSVVRITKGAVSDLEDADAVADFRDISTPGTRQSSPVKERKSYTYSNPFSALRSFHGRRYSGPVSKSKNRYPNTIGSRLLLDLYDRYRYPLASIPASETMMNPGARGSMNEVYDIWSPPEVLPFFNAFKRVKKKTIDGKKFAVPEESDFLEIAKVEASREPGRGPKMQFRCKTGTKGVLSLLDGRTVSSVGLSYSEDDGQGVKSLVCKSETSDVAKPNEDTMIKKSVSGLNVITTDDDPFKFLRRDVGIDHETLEIGSKAISSLDSSAIRNQSVSSVGTQDQDANSQSRTSTKFVFEDGVRTAFETAADVEGETAFLAEDGQKNPLVLVSKIEELSSVVQNPKRCTNDGNQAGENVATLINYEKTNDFDIAFRNSFDC